MRIAIESTEEFVEVKGLRCRVWKGFTEKGIRCALLVHSIAVPEEEDQSRFLAELTQVAPPSSDVERAIRHIEFEDN